ncbi:hypothetical protein [Flavobacterium sp.]|uniref:hypothetical protein n=1 Tax=Flavobacterium sp. TaxID=239 RepID=UPI003C69E08B
MKQRLLFGMVLLSSIFLKLAAQETIIDFENGEKALWTNSPEVLSITSEKAASGRYSFKYSCATLSSIGENFQGHFTDKNGFAPGKYTMSFKIWINRKFNGKSFRINFSKPVSGEPGDWISSIWEINTLAREQWVQISKDIIIDYQPKKFFISIPANVKLGGEGTFYIDDIKLVKK